MITIPQRVLGEALLISVQKYSSKTAIIAKSDEYSYLELKISADKLAGYLVLSGIKKGDRVAIYMNNCWQSVVAIYGATLAGATFLVINPQTKADKLKYILNDSGSKILISDSILNPEFTAALEGSVTVHELIISGETNETRILSELKITGFEEIQQTDNLKVELPKIIPNDLAALIYTSGSTGFPKGVMMTHQSMVFTTWSLI